MTKRRNAAKQTKSENTKKRKVKERKAPKIEKNCFSLLLGTDPNILFQIFTYCDPLSDFPSLVCICKDWFNEFFNNPDRTIMFYKEWINSFWRSRSNLNLPQVLIRIFKTSYNNEMAALSEELKKEFDMNVKYLRRLFVVIDEMGSENCDLQLLAFEKPVFYISNDEQGIVISGFNGNFIRMILNAPYKKLVAFCGGLEEDKINYIAKDYWLKLSINEPVKTFLYEQLKQMLEYMELNTESSDNGFKLLQFVVGSEKVIRVKSDNLTVTNEKDKIKFLDYEYENFELEEFEEHFYLNPWKYQMDDIKEFIKSEKDNIVFTKLLDDRYVLTKELVYELLSPSYPEISTAVFKRIANTLSSLDEAYILKCLQKCIEIFPLLPLTLKNPLFITKIICTNGKVLKYKKELEKIIKIDRNLIIKGIKSNPNAYSYLSKQDKLDNEFLTLAVNNTINSLDSNFFCDIPEDFDFDLDITLKIIKKEPINTIQNATKLLSNKEAALIIAKHTPYVLHWLSQEEIDESIILEAMKTHFDALRFLKNKKRHLELLDFAKKSLSDLLTKEKRLLIILKQKDALPRIEQIIKITEPKLQLLFLIENRTTENFKLQKNFGPFIEEVGADSTLIVEPTEEIETIDDAVDQLDTFVFNSIDFYVNTKLLAGDRDVENLLQSYYAPLKGV
ncbi:hypothetical protein ABK040_008011 [Willaertia magna]